MFGFKNLTVLLAVAAQVCVASAITIMATPDDLLGRNEPARTTTLTFGKDVGSFVAVQNVAFRTIDYPITTTTVMTATRKGFFKSVTLPLIVGPSGWVWEALPYPSPTWGYPYFPVPVPPNGIDGSNPASQPTEMAREGNPMTGDTEDTEDTKEPTKESAKEPAKEPDKTNTPSNTYNCSVCAGAACGRKNGPVICTCVPQDCKTGKKNCFAKIMGSSNGCDSDCNGCKA